MISSGEILEVSFVSVSGITSGGVVTYHNSNLPTVTYIDVTQVSNFNDDQHIYMKVY